MSFNLSEASVYTEDDGALVVWYVVGLEGQWFATKIVAETAAARQFPNEDPTKRYMRVRYTRAYTKSALLSSSDTSPA